MPDLEPSAGLRLLQASALGRLGSRLTWPLSSATMMRTRRLKYLRLSKRSATSTPAHGFVRRQIDLAWLTGDWARYDATAQRTGHFRTGHSTGRRCTGRTIADSFAHPARFAGLLARHSVGLFPGSPPPGVAGRAGCGCVECGRTPDRVCASRRTRIGTWPTRSMSAGYWIGVGCWRSQCRTPDVLRLYTSGNRRSRQVHLGRWAGGAA